MYSVGLVLEGGGNRAIYTSGVLDAFIKEGIEFPYIIGVSAGSCNGTSFMGKNYRRQHDIAIKYANDKRYLSLKGFTKGKGILHTDWIFGEMCYDLDPLNQDEFEKSGAKLCVVATNALTGKAEYFYPTDFRNECIELKASCSLPIVANPTFIGDIPFYDGGLVDSIPLQHAFEDGCEKAVVILTQHKGFVKQPTMQNSKRLFKKYPKVGEALINRHNMYNSQLEYVKEMQKQGLAYVIQPNAPLNSGTLERDTSKLEAIYQLGFKQGLAQANEIREFLK